MGESDKPSSKPPAPAPVPVEEPAPDHDVLMLTGARTKDGQGVHALRARPSKVELAELRPIKEGKPLGDGELISLRERQGSPVLWDVKTEYASGLPKDHDGPLRVSSSSYRQGWDVVFGKKTKKHKAKPALN